MTTVVSVVREPGPITGKTSRTRKVHGNSVPPLLTPSLEMTIFKSLSWSTWKQDCRAENIASLSEEEDIWELFLKSNGDRNWDQLPGNMSPGNLTANHAPPRPPPPRNLLPNYPDWGRGRGSQEPPLLAELTLESQESRV